MNIPYLLTIYFPLRLQSKQQDHQLWIMPQLSLVTVSFTTTMNLLPKSKSKIESNGLLICNLISENLGLEKLRSDSNLRKISGPANLDLYHKREKNPGDKLKKNQVN